MILGLAMDRTTCGWALLDADTCALVDVGIVVQEMTRGMPIEHAMFRAREIAERMRDCSAIVVEEMGANAGALALSYGIAMGITAAMVDAPSMLMVAPETWQQSVVADERNKKPDYDRVAVAVERHIEQRHPIAARALAAIPLTSRDRAIDAAAIALVGHVHPQRCRSFRAPRTRRPKSLVVLNDDAGPRWIPRAGLPAGGRAQCKSEQRPCVYVHCKHHLWLELSQDRPGRPHHGKRPPTTLRDVWGERNCYPRWHVRPGCHLPPSCELDVTAANPDGITLTEIGEALGVQESRARQLYDSADEKYRAERARLGIDDESGATPG